MKTCYFCDKLGSTREHVPPKGVFPIGERTNLLTVPSCEEHNTWKTEDDTYLIQNIVPLLNNIGVTKAHFKKIERGIQRNKGKHLQIVERLEKGMRVRPDEPRLRRICCQMAAAIHYHREGEKFDGTYEAILGFMERYDNPTRERIRQELSRINTNEAGWKTHGANPSVFVYHISPIRHTATRLLVLEFFSSAKVFVQMTATKDKVVVMENGLRIYNRLKHES